MTARMNRETVTKRIDPFATEWSMWDENDSGGEQNTQTSEDAQPGRRAQHSKSRLRERTWGFTCREAA